MRKKRPGWIFYGKMDPGFWQVLGVPEPRCVVYKCQLIFSCTLPMSFHKEVTMNIVHESLMLLEVLEKISISYSRHMRQPSFRCAIKDCCKQAASVHLEIRVPAGSHLESPLTLQHSWLSGKDHTTSANLDLPPHSVTQHKNFQFLCSILSYISYCIRCVYFGCRKPIFNFSQPFLTRDLHYTVLLLLFVP